MQSNSLRAGRAQALRSCLLLTVFFGLLMGSAPPTAVAQAATIQFGETVAGTIDAPGAANTYTFTAAPGDTILVAMSRVSGNLWQRIRLFDPDGRLLRDAEGAVHAEFSQRLPIRYTAFVPAVIATAGGSGAARKPYITAGAAGTYTLVVSDGFNGTYTGGYSLHLQRLSDPAGATDLAFGQTLTGTVNQPAETRAYTFTAVAGDRILVSQSRVSGNLWQKIRLFDADGNLLNEVSGSVHAELVAALPQTSDYTLLISDGFNGTYTGTYSIYMQRLNNPANATPLAFGQTVTGTVNQPAQMTTYTFDADAGDRILLGMSRVSGNLWQEIRLYDAGGNLLNEQSGSVHAENVYTVPAGGAYHVLLTDGFNGTYTGTYSLHIQRLNDPTPATALAFGATVSGSINQPAEMDAFTFAADAGDRILLGMSRVSGSLWQKIRLYDPDGNLLNEQSGSVHAENVYTVPVSGEYRVLLADGFNGTYTGSYNLAIQRLNNPGAAVALAFGETLAGVIELPAEMDTYTFSATAGDSVRIAMTRTSGSLWQQIRLYGPDAGLLREEGGSSQAELILTLPATGQYVILASDAFNGTYTGSYNIALDALP